MFFLLSIARMEKCISYSIYSDVLKTIDVKKLRFEICHELHENAESYYKKEVLSINFIDGNLIHAILVAPFNEEFLDSLVFTEIVKSLQFLYLRYNLQYSKCTFHCF